MGKFKYLIASLLLCASFGVNADNNGTCTNNQDCYNSGVYIYEGGQDLIDLQTNYIATSYNLNSGDDSWSSEKALGMEWNRWGQTWSHARMSTNGCVNLTSGSAGGTSANCQDYTPQSLPYQDYTLYPFWTDLIRSNSSKMLFRDFGDHVVFGWYHMKEYNRSSSNSFEAILYDNNSFEYRYRELDIINHDVLIGEQGHHSSTPADTKTYLFYNDGQSGYNNLDAYLANSGWPDIENGGSLYGGTETQMCAIDALYSSSCSEYAAAYLTQQCALSSLYSSECSGYAAAYLSQQCALSAIYDESCTGYSAAILIYECDIDVFYATSCSGYASALAAEQAAELAMYEDQYGYDDGYDEYGNEEDQYGYDEYGNAYTEEDLWYDEEYDEYLDPNDPCYQNGCENMTDADWYALDVEQFGQEQVDDWFGEDVEFADDGMMDYGTSTEEEFWEEIDQGMDTYDQEQEILRVEEELAWQLEEEQFYYEEEQRMLEEQEMMAQEELLFQEEEALYATLTTDADWYDYEVEEFGQEQVDEWWGEDISFSEGGFVEESFVQVEDIYILEEAIGIEIFTEEEWSTDDELDIYEEVLEDYEREAIEDHEDEIYEVFEEAYDEEELYLEEDEAFEDLIDEEELDELINEEHEEEFYEEDQEEFFEEEDMRDDDSDEPTQQKSFTVMIAQQEEQKQEQVIQQAVSQDSAPSSSQAVVAAIDFGGTQEEQTTVAVVLQEQLEDGSGSTTGGSFDSNSFSTGSGSTIASSSQQEQVSQSTGDTLVMDQQDQVTGQVQIQVADIDDSGPVVSAFEVSEQQQDLQDEQQELTFDDGSNFTVADQTFETSFDDALGAGQSIGQFLSNTTPTFAKFDIAPPTVSEQNVSSAVESLADRVGSQVAAQNLQAQIQDVQQGGGFDVDQTATVAFIGYTAGFSDYTGQEQISDKDDWYISKTMYKDNKIDDNKFSFYMMAGKTQQKLQEMINSQYNQ
tara:strand:+ start:3101 stop:6022 length:2922 start_codon:yes stop_codon:yes gene_type:complete